MEPTCNSYKKKKLQKQKSNLQKKMYVSIFFYRTFSNSAATRD